MKIFIHFVIIIINKNVTTQEYHSFSKIFGLNLHWCRVSVQLLPEITERYVPSLLKVICNNIKWYNCIPESPS